MLNRSNFEELMMSGNANRRRMSHGGAPGYHTMPDGTHMKNSSMKKKNNGGSMTRHQKKFKETIMPGTNRGMQKKKKMNRGGDPMVGMNRGGKAGKKKGMARGCGAATKGKSYNI
jgi:hypothetical protein